jgi:hypothetical protein
MKKKILIFSVFALQLGFFLWITGCSSTRPTLAPVAGSSQVHSKDLLVPDNECDFNSCFGPPFYTNASEFNFNPPTTPLVQCISNAIMTRCATQIESHTQSPTATITITQTPSITITPSPSGTQTPSMTPSPSGTITLTATETYTPNTPTLTPTPDLTPTQTEVPTNTLPDTPTNTPDFTPTPTCNPNGGTFTNLGVDAGGELPESIQSGFNSLLSLLPFKVQINNASYSFSVEAKDCCLNNSTISNGDKQETGGFEVGLSADNVPIVGVVIDKEVELGFGTADVSLEAALTASLGAEVSAQGGLRNNICTSENCGFYNIGASINDSVQVTIQAADCINYDTGGTDCGGLTVTPAGASTSIGVSALYNEDNCDEGPSGNISVGGLTIFAEVEVSGFSFEISSQVMDPYVISL